MNRLLDGIQLRANGKYFCMFHQVEFERELMKRLQLAEGREVRVCPKCVVVEQGLEKPRKKEDNSLGKCTACNKDASFTCIGCRTSWCKDHQWGDEPMCVFCKTQGRWYD